MIILSQLPSSLTQKAVLSDTEIVSFGSRANLNKISGSDLCLPVGSDIKPRELVCDLGVYFDSELSFKQQITS